MMKEWTWDEALQEPIGFVNQYFLDWMRRDVDGTVKTEKNLLAALALSVYTEVLGGYLEGTHEPGHSQVNYERGLAYLGSCYDPLIKNGDAYRRVRCGLVHTYFIKGPSGVYVDQVQANCGLSRASDGRITFAVKKYQEDFFRAVERYRDELSQGKNRERFGDAIRSLIKDAQESLEKAGTPLPSRPLVIGATKSGVD